MVRRSDLVPLSAALMVGRTATERITTSPESKPFRTDLRARLEWHPIQYHQQEQHRMQSLIKRALCYRASFCAILAAVPTALNKPVRSGIPARTAIGSPDGDATQAVPSTHAGVPHLPRLGSGVS